MTTKNNHLNFLKDLKLFCDFKKPISIKELARKHELKYYVKVAGILIKNGIVHKINTKNAFTPYVWNTIEPNIHMAKELEKKLNEISLYQQEKYYEKVKSLKTTKKNKELKEVQIVENVKEVQIVENVKEVQIVENVKEIENSLLDNITIKLLFGLIKIHIKLNYKKRKKII